MGKLRPSTVKTIYCLCVVRCKSRFEPRRAEQSSRVALAVLVPCNEVEQILSWVQICAVPSSKRSAHHIVSAKAFIHTAQRERQRQRDELHLHLRERRGG